MRRIVFLLALCLAALFLAACGKLDVSILEATPAATKAAISPPAGVEIVDSGPEATVDGAPVSGDELSSGDTTPPAMEPTSAVTVTLAEATVEASDEGVVSAADAASTEQVPTARPTQQTNQCNVRSDWPLYSVKKGDTLGRIARVVNASVDQLVMANCLDDPDRLYSGQEIRVPTIPSDIPGPSATVQPEAWLRHYDALYQVSFEHPAAWQDVSHGWLKKLSGEDGFVQLAGASAPADLDTVAADQAFHKLQPYGSAPSVEPIVLHDGRAARLILPSADQSAPLAGQGLIVTMYAQPIYIGDTPFNYLMLAADTGHIRSIGDSLTLPPAAADTSIDEFSVEAQDLPSGGKRLTFRWLAHGANRGVISSGTGQRFAPWWAVESAGELIVDVDGTLFADPTMTLRVVNDVSGREAMATAIVSWACYHQYFFQPGASYCPRDAALVTEGAYQPFEGGFMIWLPRPELTAPSIYVFTHGGQLSLYPDTMPAEASQGVAEETPPEGLFEPVGGFGKVWREHALVRETLGWATAAEGLYTATFQVESRESLPGVAYLTLPDGKILQLMDSIWRAYVPGADLSGIGGSVAP
jgi:LysM repeat protein